MLCFNLYLHTVKHYFSPHLNFAISLCCILISRIFQLILSSNLFHVFLVPETNVNIEIRPVLLFTLYNTKNIAYHITEEFHILCRQNHGDGQFQKSACFNFTTLLKQ